MEGDWLTPGEVARMLRIPERTVLGLVARGDLPGTGHPVRIQRSEIWLFVEQRLRIRPGTVGGNQYAGRPEKGVAEWYRTKGKRPPRA